MNRKPTFSIRNLMLLTFFASLAIAIFAAAMRRTPRPYKTLDRFTKGHISRGWKVEFAPDVEGPYRTAGDDWSGSAIFHCGSGQPAKGWVDSGTSRRTFNYPGRDGVSYLVLGLENREDQPTYLILSKPDDDSSRDPSGG